jgi:hypothetical protein
MPPEKKMEFHRMGLLPLPTGKKSAFFTHQDMLKSPAPISPGIVEFEAQRATSLVPSKLSDLVLTKPRDTTRRVFLERLRLDVLASLLMV